MVLVSHPTGNANVRQVLLALYEREMLAAFHTTVVWNADSVWNHLLPAGARRELMRRSYPDIPGRLIHTAPLRELCRVVLQRSGMNGRLERPGSPLSAPGVYRYADAQAAKAVGRLSIQAVYAYDGGALESFRTARAKGIKTIYELPTAHTRFKVGFFREEAELQPEFAGTLATARVDEEWLRRKDEELQLCDCVIVPSTYVQSTLPGFVRPEQVRVLPYGAPAIPSGEIACRGAKGSKLRVLFVGNLSQGKGLSYLLTAIRKVERAVEFTMIGSRVASCKPLDDALIRYRWINSVPHDRVLNEMSRHDVLVLPTLSEGLALVILEAMSRGMAVVTTPNSGAVGILRDGVDGYMVPIRSAEAVAEKLELLAGDAALLETMQQAARKRAQEFSWRRYREQLASTVEEKLNEVRRV